ncbi:MAG: hypothetical protein HWD61_08330 [Parachlamydiaceae bacterium]|nr:MAG: hypothetical protein HWD61_08330 [Parachlamydiaceae bacterium]
MSILLNFYGERKIRRKDKGTLHHRPLEIGDWCYFEGVKGYLTRHTSGGNGYGVNVIYIGKNPKGEQLFIGFDFDHAVTEREIYQNLIDLYLLPPTDAFGEVITNDPPGLFPTFDDVIGFKPDVTKRFNYQLIVEIKNNPLTQEFMDHLKAKGFLLFRFTNIPNKNKSCHCRYRSNRDSHSMNNGRDTHRYIEDRHRDRNKNKTYRHYDPIDAQAF